MTTLGTDEAITIERNSHGPIQRVKALHARVPQNRWVALVSISLAQLMVIMDTSIIIVALPSAQQSLGMSDAVRQWIVTAYTLSYGGLLLLGGRLADRIGQRRTLVIAMIGFATASAISGSATGEAMLIASRAVQGAFGALLTPSATSFVALLFPVSEPQARAKALGIFSAVAVGGASLGLVLGGVLTNSLSWRWSLYLNIPLAVIAALGALMLLPNRPDSRQVRLDIPGAILACGGVAALVYGFGEAGQSGWQSLAVVVALSLAGALMVAFIILQARIRNPLLPLRIVAERNRAGSFVARMLLGMGQFAMFLLLTYQLQVIMGYSPLTAGLALLPLLVANTLGSAGIAPRLMPHISPRFLIVPGLLLNAAGLLALTQLTPTTTYLPLILGAELLLGLGGGLTIAPALNTALTGINSADTGIASALASASQQVGASVGTALFSSIAAFATAAYVTAHRDDASQAIQSTALVHGYAVAAAWGAAILLVGALLVGILIITRPRPHKAA